jgi:hypothetical protein
MQMVSVWSCSNRADRIAEDPFGINPFLKKGILGLQSLARSVSFEGADLNIESDTSI